MMKKLLIAALLTGSTAMAEIETVATFDADTPPGNLAIGPDGRIFMSVHEFYGLDLRLVEVMPDGSTVPYPTET